MWFLTSQSIRTCSQSVYKSLLRTVIWKAIHDTLKWCFGDCLWLLKWCMQKHWCQCTKMCPNIWLLLRISSTGKYDLFDNNLYFSLWLLVHQISTNVFSRMTANLNIWFSIKNIHCKEFVCIYVRRYVATSNVPFSIVNKLSLWNSTCVVHIPLIYYLVTGYMDVLCYQIKQPDNLINKTCPRHNLHCPHFINLVILSRSIWMYYVTKSNNLVIC